MKKLVLAGLFFTAIVIAVFFVVFQKNKNRPLPIGEVPVVSGPDKFGGAERKAVFTYAGPAVELPASLPTYKVAYPADLPEKTGALAKQWGFTATLSQPVPYVYDWIDDTKHLSYNDRSKNISFSLFSSARQGQQPALAPQGVFSALTTSGLLSNDFLFFETNRQTIRSEGEGADKSMSPIAVITYQSKIKGRAFPFFFSSVTRTAGEIRVNAAGRVISFSFYATAAIVPEQERQMLGLDRAVLELNSGKGYLTGLSNDASGYSPEASPSFTEVKIDSITPAFLFVDEESRFVPIYVIEGRGHGQAVQRVRYFLRASG